MASLSPSCPSANLAVRKLKSTIAVSAASNPNLPNQAKKTADIVQKELITADPKRPWWAPLFRFGSERNTGDQAMRSGADESEMRKSTARRSGLTAEKARVLRKELRAMECWHDAMYHSAIASRLASPDQS
ncbi:uncharacterized protein LOC131248668 [Magnolia sinica]|uniref:uncharacterized protein LOC131248668 n=1 Tax=Magnolia sinica TaxID=86752 RepID=UPI00265869AA|nr:uncharacterized protein LOC131248668 [Magnolia sinica]